MAYFWRYSHPAIELKGNVMPKVKSLSLSVRKQSELKTALYEAVLALEYMREYASGIRRVVLKNAKKKARPWD